MRRLLAKAEAVMAAWMKVAVGEAGRWGCPGDWEGT